MQIADTKQQLEDNWDKLFGKQARLPLMMRRNWSCDELAAFLSEAATQVSNAVSGHY